jgi:putative ABC transport system ATP-binding protein
LGASDAGRVSILACLHKLLSRVSGSQQQRAAIANDPPLVLGDEPTGNLDSGSTEVVFELFSRLVDEGKTILMVTQDERLASRMPRQIELSEGRVIRDTQPASLVTSSAPTPLKNQPRCRWSSSPSACSP